MGNKASRDRKQKIKTECTVFMLGIGGSGKSTFGKKFKFRFIILVKQIFILHKDGFTNDERSSYREIILVNILKAMKEMSDFAENSLDISTENRKTFRRLGEVTVGSITWDKTFISGLKSLWKDTAIQTAWKASSKFSHECFFLEYYMANLDKYIDLDYLPTNEEILRARQRTTGVDASCSEIIVRFLY